MNITEFVDSLTRLRLVEIRALASDITDTIGSDADEIAATRAVLAIEREVRVHRCSTAAAVMSQQAARAVVRAAERDGAEMPDADVQQVVRMASQIVRGMVVGSGADEEVRRLLTGFRRLLAPAATS